MTAQTESVQTFFEQVFDNLRKTAETQLQLQQELFRQWGSNWPGFTQPQTAWTEQVEKFQKGWTKTVRELLSKHREALDEQYGLALESMDEAFKVAQASDPEEYAKRCESLCRKCLDVLRETGEMQIKEIQQAVAKWSDLATKSAK